MHIYDIIYVLFVFSFTHISMHNRDNKIFESYKNYLKTDEILLIFTNEIIVEIILTLSKNTMT